MERFNQSEVWKFFGVLPRANRRLATAWWTLLVLDGALPAAFVVAMGALVRAVQGGDAQGPACPPLQREAAVPLVPEPERHA